MHCRTLGVLKFPLFQINLITLFFIYISDMSSSEAATPQAGVFAGLNPAEYNPSDPIVLFIIQVADIQATTQ